jgi:Spy/CpxP family protein refolding chaperone
MINDRMDGFLDRINATEEQRAAAEDIREEFLFAAMPLIGQAMQGREALRDAWQQEQPDGEAMHAAVDTIGTSITGVIHLVVDAALTFRGLLTEEQLAQLR